MTIIRVGSRLPVGGKQRIDLIDFHGGQTGQDVGEVILRIDAATAATDENGVNYSAAPAGIGVSDEEPASAADGGGTNGIFDQVIVDFESAVFEISGQGLVDRKSTRLNSSHV